MKRHSIKFLGWLFDKPLRSRTMHRLARFYCRVQTEGIRSRVDIESNGELYLLRRFLPTCHTSFDVGANQGEWIERALEVNPNLTIHAFEPVPGTCRILRSRKWPLQVRINATGLSDREGSTLIYSYGEGSGLSSLHRRTDLEAKSNSQQATPVEIQLDTVDAYCGRERVEKIGYLKIDVEGHEFAVLRGAERMLSEGRIDALQIEYGTSYRLAGVLLRDVFEYLGRFGFVGARIEPHTLQRHDTYHARLEDFRLSNWVFAKPDNDKLWGQDVAPHG